MGSLMSYKQPKRRPMIQIISAIAPQYHNCTARMCLRHSYTDSHTHTQNQRPPGRNWSKDEVWLDKIQTPKTSTDDQFYYRNRSAMLILPAAKAPPTQLHRSPDSNSKPSTPRKGRKWRAKTRIICLLTHISSI